ncbi:MAG: hypothetical protein LBS52_00230 [Dysgonamonadaceae bacterium]|jgi:uncharacterized protein (DUF608 family)|nr:hypothetical protein [Dysgonamonadaceae bacterium]
MKNKPFYLLLSVILLTVNVMAQNIREKTDGYPLSNFGLTVNVPQNGDLFGEVLQNTGELGEWLNARGKVKILLEKDGETQRFLEFGEKKITREFPFVEGVYEKSPLTKNAIITTRAFCPLGINDVETSALPVLMLEIDVKSTDSIDFHIKVNTDELKKSNLSFTSAESMKMEPVQMNAAKIRICLAFYDKDWYSAKQFKNAGEIAEYAMKNWDKLYNSTKEFSEKIPKTGDKELDEYLRWYMVPGIALTRVNKNDEALTMGYCELNQRDSYWTSWLHLVLYKDLERKMLAESVEYQQESGKIPTTILPLIERHDDLDINAFFILREARFYRFYKDKTVLSADWTAMKKAMDWLISRDKSRRGLPEQVSFWGDWKDVQGVKERHYSPFSGLIYLAALKEIAYLGGEVGDNEAVAKYKAAYKKGYDFINKPTSKGGLWNGNYYCQIWKDGSVNEHLLQDQTIGVLFNVVPQKRANAIIKSLNKQSLTKYGIAETFPYYPKEFGYAPATYHNGAVWPWLSFMDCWARIEVGKKSEAIKLVKAVAKADLVDSGDYSPNEHINSLTGENLGFILQGWNAGLYGLVYFGLLHREADITGHKTYLDPK